MSENLEKQLDLFKQFLKTGSWASTSPTYKTARDFIEKFPRKLTDEEHRDLRVLMTRAFNLPYDIEDAPQLKPFEDLIPKEGWLREYYEYTLGSEPPTVFHFMAALTVLGATLERNVYFDKGFYRVYANIATVLIAPTGKCRKTSATNIALRLGRDIGVNVLSDRMTPEALVLGLSGRETATGLVYAPELAVFLGKQKYLEGMVPLLTTLFDSPEHWNSRTIGRGELHLSQVALSFLGASTLEWFVEALPREAFSGGFMSRLLFVVQEDTDREFALPERGLGHLWERLREKLVEIKEIKGEVQLEPDSKHWYLTWYGKHKKTPLSDAKFAGYHERKPDHLLRLAFLLRVSDNLTLTIRVRDFERALKVLDWLEASLPHVFDTIAATPAGAAHQRILRQIQELGGRVPHSVLLRKNQHYMNARAFREAIETLKESECITEERSNLEHVYELVVGGKNE